MNALERAIRIAGTQEKLAELIGVSQGRISQWRNRSEAIPSKYFPRIEEATGVSAHDLLDFELAKLSDSAQLSRGSAG